MKIDIKLSETGWKQTESNWNHPENCLSPLKLPRKDLGEPEISHISGFLLKLIYSLLFFLILNFWINSVTKLNILQIEWILTNWYIVISWLRFWLLFFSKMLLFIFLDKLCPKVWCSQKRDPWFHTDFNFFYCFFNFFFLFRVFGQILLQNLKFSKWIKFRLGLFWCILIIFFYFFLIFFYWNF